MGSNFCNFTAYVLHVFLEVCEFSRIGLSMLYGDKGPLTKDFRPSYRLLVGPRFFPLPLYARTGQKVFDSIPKSFLLTDTNHGVLLISILLENLMFGNADKAKSELNISLAWNLNSPSGPLIAGQAVNILVRISLLTSRASKN